VNISETYLPKLDERKALIFNQFRHSR